MIEGDKEELVIVVARLDEPAQGVKRPLQLARHAARDVIDDAERHRDVVVAEELDVLFEFVVEDLEVRFFESRHETAVRVRYGDVDRHDVATEPDIVIGFGRRHRLLRARRHGRVSEHTHGQSDHNE